MKYKAIRLKHLPEIVPSLIRNKLDKNGYSTVGDLLEMGESDIERLRGFGAQSISALRELMQTLNDDRDKVTLAFESGFGTVIPGDTTHEGFGHTLLQIVTDYFRILAQEKPKDIFCKRYGIEDGKRYTLEDIGVFYSLSRERVRQIQDKHLRQIRELLVGSRLKKPTCVCKPSSINEFRRLRRNLMQEKTVPEISMLENIGFDPDQKDLSSNQGVCLLLTELVGGQVYETRGHRYYLFDTNITLTTLDRAVHVVRRVLADCVIPLKLFDIVLQAHKVDTKLTRQLVIQAIEVQQPEIETIAQDGETFYQLMFSNLSSFSNMAYRILYEKQVSLHFNEIWREIQHRLARGNNKLREHKRSLNAQLVADDRFSPIGWSGQWGLTNWGNSTASIIELVIKAIYFHNNPCDISMLESFVTERRPQVSKHSIASVISRNQERVIRLRDGRYILSEWADQFKQQVAAVRRDRISAYDFEELLEKIYAEERETVISSVRLKKLLSEKRVVWADSMYYARFNRCDALVKTQIEGKVHYSFRRTSSTPKKGKLELVRDSIHGFLKGTEGTPIPLKDVVIEMKRMNIPSHTTYAVISTNPATFRKTIQKGVQYIQIETEPSRTEQESQEERVSNIMKTGESDLVEFKSSLR